MKEAGLQNQNDTWIYLLSRIRMVAVSMTALLHLSYIPLVHRLEGRIQRWTGQRRLGRRLVVQDFLNFIHNFWRKFRDDFESLQVIHDLLRTRGAEDDRTCAGLLCDPCEREVVQFAA